MPSPRWRPNGLADRLTAELFGGPHGPPQDTTEIEELLDKVEAMERREICRDTNMTAQLDELPRYFLVALANAERAFGARSVAGLSQVNAHLQSVVDAAVTWLRSVERERDEARTKADCLTGENHALREQLAEAGRVYDEARAEIRRLRGVERALSDEITCLEDEADPDWGDAQAPPRRLRGSASDGWMLDDDPLLRVWDTAQDAMAEVRGDWWEEEPGCWMSTGLSREPERHANPDRGEE